MSSNNLARIAGVSSIASVVAIAVAFAMVVTTAGMPSPLATTLFLLSTLLIAPVMYALFVFFRSQAQTLALIALVLGLISVVLGVIAPTPDSNAMVFNASSVLGGIAIFIFGYLGLSNAKMPRALSVVAMLLGVASALSAIADIIGLGLIVLFIIWGLWLGWLFLKGKLL